MNYLAHVFLVKDDPDLIIGSLLGDFVKGAIADSYPFAIRKGIELHRRVDSYTDSHPLVHTSKRLISAPRRRFAGIIIDLFYDHFLAKHWMEYSAIPLHDFSQQVYAILLDSQERLPEALQRVLPYMVEQNWLVSYQFTAHIHRALNGLAHRLRYKNTLLNSAEELEWHYDAFEHNFRTFFPDLMMFAESYKRVEIDPLRAT